jgi:ABC-type polysaccharide/polyol phosphate transport system ATPase subunit
VTALLSARDVGKRYTVRPERSLALGFVRRNRPRTLWALRHFDLEVAGGEVVSLIGRNGAGKSTFLKLAAGVARASEGQLTHARRVAPLIEVGAGFHPELTGRENVEINGRLLGLGSREIAHAFDAIVAFAEMEHAIDQPVKQYSSGMFMRLGFAVAVHTRPELLVVDEVLAVGDLPFQVRCLDRIREMKAEGVGILFVSHNLGAVASLADRAVLLEHGEVVSGGDVHETIGAYHALLADDSTVSSIGEETPPTGELRAESIEVRTPHGPAPALWDPGQRAVVAVRLVATAPVSDAIVGVRLAKEGAGVIAAWHAQDGTRLPALAAGEVVDIELEMSLNFVDGAYLLEVAAASSDWRRLLFADRRAYRFALSPRRHGDGLVDIDPALRVSRPEEATAR